MLKKLFKLKSLEIKSFFNDFKDYKVKNERNDYFDVKFYLKKENIHNLKNNKNKFAIITSGKNFKKAVIRNKIRRQFYTIVENYLKNNKNIKITDGIIFYPKKEILKIKFLDLKVLVYNVLNNNLK